MPNILGALGNVGKFAGEWAMNMGDPQRQQFQRNMELQRMKYILEGQRDSALNRAAREEIRMQGERDKTTQQYNTMRDANLPSWARSEAAGRLDYTVPPIAAPDITNPGARALLRDSPTAWDEPMSPLQMSEIDKNLAAGIADRRIPEPRAPNKWDIVGELSGDQRVRAVGGLPPEATPAADPTDLDWIGEARKWAGLGRGEYGPHPFGGDPYLRKPPLNQDILQPLVTHALQQGGFSSGYPGATGSPGYTPPGDKTDQLIAEAREDPVVIRELREAIDSPLGQKNLTNLGYDVQRLKAAFGF